MRAAFIDKDGTLVDDVPYNIDPARVRLSAGAVAGLRLLRRQGFKLFVVTNQPGVARGYFREAELMPLFDHLHRVLECQDVAPDGYFYCPHSPDGIVPRYAIECECRKPLAGMLFHAAQKHGIDLSASWMIGDILNDVECGRRAGCRTVLIDNGNETEWQWSSLRRPHLVAPDLHAAATMICRFEDAKSMSTSHSNAES
jgi:D,D-heptose 1,7-bisphosphate phosphatase